MLVNLTPDKEEQKRRAGIAEDHGFNYLPQDDPKFIQETGIYQCSCPFNFSKEEFIELQRLSWKDRYSIFPPESNKGTYGVADTIEQIKDYYAKEVGDPEQKFALALTPVYQEKENKGKGGGWRWHKWGPYIGKLNPKCEYLDDENFGEDFQYVIVFGIYKIK